MSGSTPWPSANHRPFGIVHAERRHRDAAAVDQVWRSGDADQPAPRARADERAQLRFAEVERERIAARSAPSVDQHHLRSAVRDGRPLLAGSVADAPVAEDRPVQQLDEPVWNLSAAVEPLVDDECVLGALGHELPDELVLRLGAGALHVDVAGLAARRLVHAPAPFLDPGAEPQLHFVVEALDQHLTRALHCRPAVDGEPRRLVCQPVETGPRIARHIERRSVDGEHVVAFGHGHAWLEERRPHVRVPRSAADDPLDSIRTVGELPIHAQHADAAVCGIFLVASAAVRM